MNFFTRLISISLLLGMSSWAKSEPQTPNGNIVQFTEGDRYFPDLMLQFETPAFIWDDFFTYKSELWGDDQGGEVEIAGRQRFFFQHGEKSDLWDGVLVLKNKQMIWSLFRLPFGQFECRWCGLGKLASKEDKFIGFGDPAEGYAAGFRKFNHQGAMGLYAFLINHGQSALVPIPWKKEYQTSTRFIVEWGASRVRFITITAEKFETVAVFESKHGDFIPQILMEISLQSFGGNQGLTVDLVKYDEFSNKR